MGRPRILYFDIRGRIEAVRLLFEDQGISYQDDRVDITQWPNLKPTLPFRELPLCELGGVVIVQSQAILRHVARTHDLFGEDERERCNCDIAAEAIAEAREKLWQYQWRQNYEETRDSYAQLELSPRLEALECWFVAYGGGEHWVHGRLTYVDFLAFAFLDELRAFFPDTLKAFAKLRDFHGRFGQRSRIAAYLQSSRRPKAFGYSMAGLS